MIKRCVTTIAVGKPYYQYLAMNLLKSFLLWNRGNNIHFLLVTDDEGYFKEYQNTPGVTIEKIALDESDKSFTAKFYLYKYTQAEENIFIDSDCLVYGSLAPVFDKFSGNNFSAIGNNISVGEFFCDVEKTCRRFGLSSMPKFVGAVYYFKKNAIAKHIFDKAEELKQQYDELEFINYRGKEAEEPLFAVAMELDSEKLIKNDGSIKADLMYYKEWRSNITSGLTTVKKPLTGITEGEEIPEVAHPAILHFNSNYTESYYYKGDVFRLNKPGYNKALVEVLVWIKFIFPYQLKAALKALFRPIYRLLFGYRAINSSQRMA